MTAPSERGRAEGVVAGSVTSIVVAGLAVGLACVVALTRAPLGGPLEVDVYRDDAYYYFDWVRNVAAGHGPVVGAGAPTSGVHVGWAALLLPLVAFGGDGLLEQGARWLGLASAIAAAVILARAAWRDGAGALVALTVGVLLLGHPSVWDEAQNGQETGLALAAAAWLWHERRAPMPRFVLACVLLSLARSDLWPLALGLAIVRDGPLRSRLVAPGFALAALVGIDLALAGHPLKDSAGPMAWLFGERLAAEVAAGRDPLEARWWWWRPVLLGTPYVRFAAVGTAAALALAVGRGLARPWFRRAAALAVAVLPCAALVGLDDLWIPMVTALLLAVGAAAGWRPSRPSAWSAAVLVAAGVVLVVAHFPIRLYPRPYYFVPLTLFGCIALGMLARSKHPLAPLALAAAIVHQAGLAWTPPPTRPLQRAMAVAGQELGRFVPAGAAVGAFNSGLVTWHAHPRPILNLDGVVNRPAFDALREGRLGEYLDAHGVRWLVDNPVQFALDPTLPHACGRSFGGEFDPARDLREVARFVVPGVSGDRPGTDAFSLYARGGAPSDSSNAFDSPEVAAAADGQGLVVCWRGRAGAVLEVRDAREGTLPDAVLARVDAVPGVTLVLAFASGPARPDDVACVVLPR